MVDGVPSTTPTPPSTDGLSQGFHKLLDYFLLAMKESSDKLCEKLTKVVDTLDLLREEGWQLSLSPEWSTKTLTKVQALRDQVTAMGIAEDQKQAILLNVDALKAAISAHQKKSTMSTKESQPFQP